MTSNSESNLTCDECDETGLSGPELMDHVREDHPWKLVRDGPIKIVNDEQ